MNELTKLICLVLACVILILVFVACEQPTVGEFIPTGSETPARFREIGRETIATLSGDDQIEKVIYYVDTHTNIVYMYFIDWHNNATRGGVTVLYNADGTPMTLNEFMN